MSKSQEIKVPDLGNTADAEIIEISVKPGDQFQAEQTLIVLESDKASMEIPAPSAGVVETIKVKIGDKVSSGSVIITATVDVETEAKSDESAQAKPTEKTHEPSKKSEATAQKTDKVLAVNVPDLGSVAEVEVIEINVAVGDAIAANDTLVTLEGDKAAMEIPAPQAGIVKELKLKVGDKVKTGSPLLLLETSEAHAQPEQKAEIAPTKQAEAAVENKQQAIADKPAAIQQTSTAVHAGPAVRRFARELGVDLSQVAGTGPKSRIVKQDVQGFVKKQLAGGALAAAGGFSLPKAPQIDFSQFGTIETKSLSRIKKLTGINLSRNWLLVPHVTQFEDADITEMESFRKAQQASLEKQGVKLTPLVFIMKAVVDSLKAFPQFNSSLDATGENLILKKYFNIGIAVDTPDGLVVPVVRDVDQKGLVTLAKELAEISNKARNKGLSSADMQGGCFTISSLGGIGGSGFTPIVNVPEVAILGISKASMKPVYQDSQFVPRLMLPLSLSYDHRVVDGAEGARFIVHLANGLSDIRRLLL